MLKLGRAQGVAIAAAIQAGLTVNEYSPKKIKQSITGNGNAGKEQVMKMLQQLLNFDHGPAYMDASDAIAVAVCHHFQQKSILPPGKSSRQAAGGWKEFLLKNPARIK
jgi:crossover junction endodeoxyribonuclease RuvC